MYLNSSNQGIYTVYSSSNIDMRLQHMIHMQKISKYKDYKGLTGELFSGARPDIAISEFRVLVRLLTEYFERSSLQ